MRGYELVFHDGGVGSRLPFPARTRVLRAALGQTRRVSPASELERLEVRDRLGTVISWGAMRDETGVLVWVLDHAGGMGAGECERYGIDWKAERAKRLRLWGTW